jgi:hypothetical protein
MSEPMTKIYIGALTAIFPSLDGAGNQTRSTFFSIPAMLPAVSVEAAAEAARAASFERWKAEDGWYGHQANIMPVTKAFLQATLNACAAGVVGDIEELSDDEPPQTFNFEAGPQEPEEWADVIG